MRRRLVDGDSMGGVFTFEFAGSGGAVERREVRGFSDAIGSQSDAEPEDGCAELAVRGRPADGRSDASADPSGDRALWPPASAAGRGADSAGRTMEIRIQGNQVDCENRSSCNSAPDDVERLRAG